MSRNYYAEKEAYVEKINETMKPLQDFGGIEYTHVYTTGAEYIKIHDTIGGAVFLNVTSHDLETILLEIIAVVVGEVPKSIITSKEGRRQIASMFRGC